MASALAKTLLVQFPRTKDDAVAICDRIGPVFHNHSGCGRTLRPVEIDWMPGCLRSQSVTLDFYLDKHSASGRMQHASG
jgi:hypothetical protein